MEYHRDVFRGVAAAGLIAWASGCLSAPGGAPDAGEGDGDGGVLSSGDAGFVPLFTPCPDEVVDYFGGASGYLDDDSASDLVLLRDSDFEPELRGIEVRLSASAKRLCSLIPWVRMRAAHVADFLPGGAPEILLIAFDGEGRRHTILMSRVPDDPVVVVVPGEEAEAGYTPSDPYHLRAVDGPLGWQILYGGPSTALSEPQVEGLPAVRPLLDTTGESLGEVLAIALEPIKDSQLRAFVATRDAVYWYDALAVPPGGASASEKLPTGVTASAAGFADLQPGATGVDGCPDLVVTTQESTPRAIAFDLTCGESTVAMAPAINHVPDVFNLGSAVLKVHAAQLGGGPAQELMFASTGRGGVIYSERDARFDEDPADASWECLTDDSTRELCAAGAMSSAVASLEWVQAVNGDLDGDGVGETNFVGRSAFEYCMTMAGADLTPCP